MPFDANGALHISAATIPQSDFVSANFKKSYVSRVAAMLTFPRPPSMSAPKTEWDTFDTEVDRFLHPSLVWNLEHYPVGVVDTIVGGVRVGVVTPRDSIAPENRGRVLINLHGGGFFTGRGLVKGQIESIPVASLGHMKVLTVDYRQAPYFSYPAASEDVESVYRELLQQYKPEAIGIFGCSAGGTLTAQAVTRFLAKGLPRPGAVGIFCAAPAPHGKRGDSSMWSVTGVPFGPNISLADSAETAPSEPTGYMKGTAPNDPNAFPGSSDAVLAQFPPTLLVSGTRSEEMSAVIVAHARFLSLGVDSYLYLMENGWHGAVFSSEGTPEGHNVNAYIARWFNEHLTR